MACNFTKVIVFSQGLRIKLFCLLPTMMEKNCEGLERDLEKRSFLDNGEPLPEEFYGKQNRKTYLMPDKQKN